MRNPTRPPEGTKCTYCPEPAVCHDHYIPRVEGGGEGPNLVPACAACNMSKGALMPWDWAAWTITKALLGGPEVPWKSRIEAVMERSPAETSDLLRTVIHYERDRYDNAASEMRRRSRCVLRLIKKAGRSL